MAGDEAEREIEALRPALAMQSDAIAFGRWSAMPERDVRRPKRLEHRDELVEIVVAMPKALDPARLVIADELGLVMSQDPAIPPGIDHLGVDDVADAFDHGPLARLGRRPEVPPRRRGKRPDPGRNPGLRLRGVVGAECREEVALVRSGFENWIRLVHVPPSRIARKASASRTATPSSSAFWSLEPAPG